MPVKRDVAEGLLLQGAEEIVPYTLTTTRWVSAPGVVTVKAYDLTAAGADVTSTVLSGSPSTAGDVISLPLVQALVAGHRYRVDVKFTAGAGTYEAQIFIQGEE